MSGGSFDYLCEVYDLESLIRKEHQLRRMSEVLERMPEAKDAAVETRTIILDMNAFEVRTLATIQRLSPVWKAIEWNRSSDWGPETIVKALDKYRGLE